MNKEGMPEQYKELTDEEIVDLFKDYKPKRHLIAVTTAKIVQQVTEAGFYKGDKEYKGQVLDSIIEESLIVGAGKDCHDIEIGEHVTLSVLIMDTDIRFAGMRKGYPIMIIDSHFINAQIDTKNRVEIPMGYITIKK